MSYYTLFAQIGYGNEKAQAILTNSRQLNQQTQESWQRLWDISVNSAEPLWQALCEFGAFIAAMSLIYLIIKEGKDGILDLLHIIEISMFPIVVSILLGGNGYILSQLVLYFRGVSLFWLTQILNMTFAGISVSDAIGKIQNTAVANTRAREIFTECIDKTGVALDECVRDPVKLEQAQELLQQLSGSTAPLNGNILERLTDGIVTSLVGTINLPFLTATQFLLNALQWCFVNVVEASLLLTALYAPIALGLSVIPSNGGKTIFKWFSGYFSLLLMPLGYVILVGFMANILSVMDNQDVPIGSSYLDTAFLFFMSIFAPIVAVAVSKGIGDGVFEGISRSLKLGADAGMAATSAGSSVAAKAIAAKMASQSLSTTPASSTLPPTS